MRLAVAACPYAIVSLAKNGAVGQIFAIGRDANATSANDLSVANNGKRYSTHIRVT